MKRILSNKFAPVYHQTQLLDQFFLHCRQGTSTIRGCLAHFEEKLHGCDIYEAPTLQRLGFTMVLILNSYIMNILAP